MITLVENAPEHIAAFRLQGNITHADYTKIVIPRIDEVAAQYGEVRFFVLLETKLGSFDLRAIWDDIKIGLKHLTIWKKTAIISDEQTARTMTDTVGQLVPGEVRSFELIDTQKAMDWIAV